jgi:anti-sigma factor RsiW
MTDVETLSCQELVELVTDWFEGALDTRRARLFEEHLAACEGCATYVEQLRRTIEATGRLTPHDLSPDAEATLLQAFRDWQRTS